jgi:hypothetical protein
MLLFDGIVLTVLLAALAAVAAVLFVVRSIANAAPLIAGRVGRTVDVVLIRSRPPRKPAPRSASRAVVSVVLGGRLQPALPG